MNNGVKCVVGIVQRYRWFIPIHQEIVEWVKRHHIPHCEQIGPNIANHYFNIVADAVVHFANTTASFVANGLLRRVIMKTDVVDVATSKRKRDALLHRNRSFCQCQPYVTCRTHEDDFVFFRQPEWRKCLSCARGCDIKHQLRARSFRNRK